MCLKFYIPLYYAFKTRMGAPLAGVSKWICEYVIPTLFCFIVSNLALNLSWIYYFLVLLLVYNIYEIGYIQNDTETIKKEEHPTLRLTLDELTFYEMHKWSIYGFRLLLGISFSAFILLFLNYSLGSLIAIGSSWIILLVYLFYNSVRGLITFLMHFMLLVLRYSVVILLFVPDVSWCVILLAVMIFPLPNIMEVIRRGKFGIRLNFSKYYLRDYDKRYQFRIKYYSFLTIVYLLFSLSGLCSYLLILLPAYYLLYVVCFTYAFSKKID